MRRSQGQLPSGPRMSPFEQSCAFTYHTTAFLDECRQRYGPVFTISTMTIRDIVMVADPDLATEILAKNNQHIFVAGAANKRTLVHQALGESFLMALDGEAHEAARRRLGGILEEARHGFLDDIRKLVLDCVALWPRNDPFSLLAEMEYLALDVILTTILGRIDATRRKAIGRAVHEMIETAHCNGQPTLFPDVARFWPARERAWALLDEEIKQRRLEGGLGRKDALSILVNPTQRDPGPCVNDRTLRETLLALCVAGYDTTATTLAWSFHHLLQSAPAIAALRPECERIASTPELDPDDVISHSSVIGRVLNETSRLHPISPVINRLATRLVRLGDWVIPKGTMVCPCIYLLHRNPALGDNLDRFVFDRRPLRPDSGFLPFGGGNRQCIGMRFAKVEMRVVLSVILTQVELSLMQRRTAAKRRVFVFVPDSGVPVVARDRLHAS